jgi:hypothetical protein
VIEQFQGSRRPQPGVKLIVLLAADLPAPHLSEFAFFLRARTLHEPEDIPFAFAAQYGAASQAAFGKQKQQLSLR